MPFNLKPREVKTEKMRLTLEIDLFKSTKTPDECAERLAVAIERSKVFSELIVFLLRETNSSMWELGGLKIDEVK